MVDNIVLNKLDRITSWDRLFASIDTNFEAIIDFLKGSNGIVTDIIRFTPTQGQSVFRLESPYVVGVNSLAVYRNKIRQWLTEDYLETSSFEFTLTKPCADTEDIVAVVSKLGGIGTKVSAAVESFVAEERQTIFNTKHTYYPNTNTIVIYRNGEQLVSGIDYIEKTDSSFVLLEDCELNDHIIALLNISVTGAQKLVQIMVGASTDHDGRAGLVPRPNSGSIQRFLRVDGTWMSPITFKGATKESYGSKGLVPQPTPLNINHVLYGSGNWGPVKQSPSATDSVSGVVKLYNATGNNVDGTMTQAAITASLTGAYTFKGAVNTFNDLPSDASTGDIYNIKVRYPEKGIKAGDNVAWNGTEWSLLANTFNLSEYLRIDSVDYIKSIKNDTEGTLVVTTGDGLSYNISLHNQDPLVPATTESIGGIVVGNGLAVNESGVLTVDVDPAVYTFDGEEYVGSDGLLSWKDKLKLDNIESIMTNAVSPASEEVLGRVRIGSNISVDSEGTISVTAEDIIQALGFTPINEEQVRTIEESFIDDVLEEECLPAKTLTSADIVDILGYVPVSVDMLKGVASSYIDDLLSEELIGGSNELSSRDIITALGYVPVSQEMLQGMPNSIIEDILELTNSELIYSSTSIRVTYSQLNFSGKAGDEKVIDANDRGNSLYVPMSILKEGIEVIDKELPCQIFNSYEISKLIYKSVINLAEFKRVFLTTDVDIRTSFIRSVDMPKYLKVDDVVNQSIVVIVDDIPYGVINGKFIQLADSWNYLRAEEMLELVTSLQRNPKIEELEQFDQFKLAVYSTSIDLVDVTFTLANKFTVIEPDSLTNISNATKISHIGDVVGNTIVKLALTKNLTTYYTYKNGAFSVINKNDISTDGIDLQDLPDIDISRLLTDRFAIMYSINISSAKDSCNLTDIVIREDDTVWKVAVNGVDYEAFYDLSSKLHIKLKNGGNYKINYESSSSLSSKTDV